MHTAYSWFRSGAIDRGITQAAQSDLWRYGTPDCRKLSVDMKILPALLLLFSSSSFAVTGNTLHGLLTHKNESTSWHGMYYIWGVFDAERMHVMLEDVYAEIEKRPRNVGRFFCPPEGVTGEQVRDIVMAHLESNPADRHIAASQLVHESLLNVWPCAK